MIKDGAGRLGRALADPLTPARFARFVARAPAVLPVVELAAIRRISMIGEATLATLRATAALTRGAVLEIGPCMGGSTVALAGGLPRGVPLATIDVGGSYLGHATLPTDDILGALGRNALHDESGNWAPGATAIGPSVAEPTAMVLLIGKCCFRVRTIPIRTKMADATRHGPGI